jgi:hypothetical protein
MKRYIKMLMTLVALAALLVMTAAPTVAKKPDNPGKPEPAAGGGVTCSRADLDIPWWHPDADVKTDDFQIILDKDNPDACVDVIPPAAGRWFVTVTKEGAGTRSLLLIPRDAIAPGDSCGGVRLLGEDIYATPIPLPYFEDLDGDRVQDSDESGDTRFSFIPLATINACPGDADPDGPNPDGQNSELVERLENGEIVLTEEWSKTDEVHPLAFLVFSRLKKAGDRIIIDVDLP